MYIYASAVMVFVIEPISSISQVTTSPTWQAERKGVRKLDGKMVTTPQYVLLFEERQEASDSQKHLGKRERERERGGYINSKK